MKMLRTKILQPNLRKGLKTLKLPMANVLGSLNELTQPIDLMDLQISGQGRSLHVTELAYLWRLVLLFEPTK